MHACIHKTNVMYEMMVRWWERARVRALGVSACIYSWVAQVSFFSLLLSSLWSDWINTFRVYMCVYVHHMSSWMRRLHNIIAPYSLDACTQDTKLFTICRAEVRREVESSSFLVYHFISISPNILLVLPSHFGWDALERENESSFSLSLLQLHPHPHPTSLADSHSWMEKGFSPSLHPPTSHTASL